MRHQYRQTDIYFCVSALLRVFAITAVDNLPFPFIISLASRQCRQLLIQLVELRHNLTSPFPTWRFKHTAFWFGPR